MLFVIAERFGAVAAKVQLSGQFHRFDLPFGEWDEDWNGAEAAETHHKLDAGGASSGSVAFCDYIEN
jgi:hypothetical protein